MRHDVLKRCARPMEYYDAPDEVVSDEGLTEDERLLVLRSMALEDEPAAAGNGDRPPNADAIARAVRSDRRSDRRPEGSARRRDFRSVVAVIGGDPEIDEEVAKSACRLARVGRGEATLAGLVTPKLDGGATMAAVPTAPRGLGPQARSDLAGEAASARGRQLDALCARYCGDIGGDLVVLGGPAAAEIGAICRRKEADVLVIGRRDGGNRSGAAVDDALLAELAAENLCPMLVVS